MKNYRVGVYSIPSIKVGEHQALLNIEVDVKSTSPFPHDRFIVGFMGSAGNEVDRAGNEYVPTDEDKKFGDEIGRIVAKHNAIMSNGACYGIPYFPIKGAKRHGGYTMGISPASSRQKLLESARRLEGCSPPDKYMDLVYFAGIDHVERPHFDLMQRDIYNTDAADIIVSKGGRWGTLDELCHVLDCGDILIPLEGSEGVTEMVIDAYKKKLIKKETGAVVLPTTIENFEKNLLHAMELTKKRWKKEGRTHNRFLYMVRPLEDKMKEIMVRETTDNLLPD